MICPHCNNEIDPEARLCPYCGKNPHFREKDKKKATAAAKVMAAVLLVIIGIVIGYGAFTLSGMMQTKEATTVSVSSISFNKSDTSSSETGTTAESTSSTTSSTTSTTVFQSTTVATTVLSGDSTVYVTKSGEKFHLYGCSSLSDSYYPLKVSEAISRGYTPCAVCGPNVPDSLFTDTTQQSTVPESSQTTVTTTAQTTKAQTTSTTKKETITKAQTQAPSKEEETTKAEQFYVDVDQPDEGVVYYHKKGCKYLSKNNIAITPEEIITDEYTPCPHCIKK